MEGRARRETFLLVFALLLLFISSYFATPEAFLKEKERVVGHENGDLFISYNGNGSNGYRGVAFSGQDFMVANSSPFFTEKSVLGSEGVGNGRDSIVSYKAQEGDTVESVAREFGVSEETIEWANSVEGSIKEGDELLILPTTGVLYYVEKNDSPGEIAEKHNADLDRIMSFNNISEKEMRPGEMLIIPDGEKPPEPEPEPAPQPRTPSGTDTGFASVTHGTVTQGDHPGHRNAVDIANACGTPIYSAASGTVLTVDYNTWPAGNFVRIDHGNLTASYVHMQNISVSPGEYVEAGQRIGTMGNTGYTVGATGCHLHFETSGAPNPFRHLQRGQRM